MRALVVGGSIGGLTAALLLRDLGHDVSVYERARGELTGFGAGIVAHPASVRYVLARTATTLASITVAVRAYRLLDGRGSLLWEEPAAYRFASWSSLYRVLLGEFGRDRYHQGAALIGFDQDARGVDLRFASGEQQRCDLLVLADGVQSTGRQQLFPGAEPAYAGYVAWRGTVAETDIPAPIHDRLDGTITYALIPNSHALVYPIPGADGRVDRGHRLWNFVWYRNVAPGAVFDELMTDRDGTPHPVSLRPGRAQDRHVREMRDVAAADLPEDVSAIVTTAEQPFIQAIMDVASPTMAVGRVCILGDAAFAVRPHAAAGTAKAAENAWTLAEAIATGGGDLGGALQRWSAHQTALGHSLLERTRHHGDGSQFRCDWRPGDPAHRFGLYEPGDSTVWARVEGRKRGPGILAGDLTPGDAQSGRIDGS